VVLRRARRERPSRSERSALRLLQLGSFTSSFDRFLIAPLILAISLDFGVSVGTATLVATVYFQAYGVMQAVWAVISDRLGRVRTIRLALLLASASGFAAAAAPEIGWLLAARAVAGASFAAAVPGALMYVGDTVPVTRRQAPLTDLMTGAALGITLSTLGAGVAGDHLSWRVAFLVPAVLAAALVLVMRGIPEPPEAPHLPVRRAFAAVLGHRWALTVLALVFFEGLILVGLLTFLPLTLQANGLSATEAGLVTAVYGAAVFVFSRFVRALTRRLRPSTLVAIGASSGTTAYLALIVDQGPVGVLLGCVCLGGAWAFMHSTLQTWVTEVVPEARGTAVSLFASLLFTGGAVASAVGAGFIDDGQFRSLYAFGFVVMAVLGATATLAQQRYSRAVGR
jgi:predicted MFS family arabinose efflux permease